jgi:hypothetical protein
MQQTTHSLPCAVILVLENGDSRLNIQTNKLTRLEILVLRAAFPLHRLRGSKQAFGRVRDVRVDGDD